MRPLPELTPANEWFWTSGKDGTLRIQSCDDCGTLVHPPTPICPSCRSRSWSPSEVSGLATVVGFTLNSHQWLPGFDPPYVVANVAFADDYGVHLTTNIVGCDPDEVHIGQEVSVLFEQNEDVWIPLFEPTGQTDPVDRVPEPRHAHAEGAGQRGAIRAQGGAERHRSVEARAPAHGRPPLSGGRRLPRCRRGCGPHAGRDRRAVDVSRWRRHGHGRGRGDRDRGGAPHRADVVQRGDGTAGAGWRGDRCGHGRRGRVVPPRPVFPHGVGVDLRHPRAPPCRWRREGCRGPCRNGAPPSEHCLPPTG